MLFLSLRYLSSQQYSVSGLYYIIFILTSEIQIQEKFLTILTLLRDTVPNKKEHMRKCGMYCKLQELYYQDRNPSIAASTWKWRIHYSDKKCLEFNFWSFSKPHSLRSNNFQSEIHSYQSIPEHQCDIFLLSKKTQKLSR